MSCCEAIFLILELDTVNVLYGKARCAIRLILSYIFSVDILKVEDVCHPKVTFLEGDADALGACRGIVSQSLACPWLVIDDANHEAQTCVRIAEFFDPLLESGDYYVIEDGIISDLYPDAYPDFSSGPHTAVRHLLSLYPRQYEIDRNHCHMFGYNATWCTNGFLRKV